jgi:hypothetical protein
MLEEAVATPIENASPAANRAINVIAIVDALALSTQSSQFRY